MAAISAPALPMLAAVGVFLALGRLGGGFEAVTWYPAALFLLGLLVVALVSVPARGRIPRTVVAAVVLLAAYAAWSYLSISWADQRGDAWDGANRTALYAIAFALFALWPLRSSSAASVLGLLGLGLAALGLFVLLEVAGAPDPAAYFWGGRFTEPAGYVNANAALWSLGLWPCLALAARPEVPAPVRGLCLGGAVLLSGLAALSQSRGWLFSLPLVVLLFLVVTPGRVRGALAVLAVAGAGLLWREPVLEVYEQLRAGSAGAGAGAAVGGAARTLVLTALGLGVLGALAALGDRRLSVSPRQARAGGAVVLAAAALAGVGGLTTWLAQGGGPRETLARNWENFKNAPYPSGKASRFGSLGSNRYDFWRVALNRFEEKPLVGVGADNFQQDYLEHGRSREQSRYPHSLAVRTLSQTGLVGALLLLGALGTALFAAIRAAFRRSGLGASVAAGSSIVFLYWLVHGSVDWFWEYPGLGAPAFAMLGLAVAVGPRTRRVDAPSRRAPLVARRAALALGVVACVLVGALGAPWLAERYVDHGATIWPQRPDEALLALDRAARLNPLASEPQLVSGSIALRVGRIDRAERDFQAALERDPRSGYAALELGAIASERGRGRAALPMLARAWRLNPRDEVVGDALRDARAGKRLSVAAVNAELLEQARELVD